MDSDNFMLLQLFAVGARSVVLVIAALAGTLCLYLGWKLYKDAVVSRTGGALETSSFKVKLAAASPGVFFVAFGTFLLVTLVNKPYKVELDQDSCAPPIESFQKQSQETFLPTTPGPRDVYLIRTAAESKPASSTGSAANSQAKSMTPECRRSCVIGRFAFQLLEGKEAKTLSPEQVQDALQRATETLKSQLSSKSDADAMRNNAALRDAITVLSILRDGVIQ